MKIWCSEDKLWKHDMSDEICTNSWMKSLHSSKRVMRNELENEFKQNCRFGADEHGNPTVRIIHIVYEWQSDVSNEVSNDV